jgi:disulfide bond formation protein DsbB
LREARVAIRDIPDAGRAAACDPSAGFEPVIHAVNTILAVLGIVAFVLTGTLDVLWLMAAFGVRSGLEAVRGGLWGYEIWAAFAVAAIATGGSLYFSEIAHYIPCELCWFQRICMYPLSIILLLMALANDHRATRYLLPLPAVGACISVYHLLVENGVVEHSKACQASAPGGCATKWIDVFGRMTIPTITLSAFALILALLLLALAGAVDDDAREAAAAPVA